MTFAKNLVTQRHTATRVVVLIAEILTDNGQGDSRGLAKMRLGNHRKVGHGLDTDNATVAALSALSSTCKTIF